MEGNNHIDHKHLNYDCIDLLSKDIEKKIKESNVHVSMEIDSNCVELN